MADSKPGKFSLFRESYFWHKLHSLTGIIPVGFYLVQHLTLNSFSLAGPDKFNGVINFFEGIPHHVFWVLKYGIIWGSFIFHAVYGIFIVSRMESNYVGSMKKYRENRYYMLQRISGLVAFAFLCYHMTTTSVAGSLYGQESTNYYHNWAGHLSEPFLGIPFFFGAVYVLGIVSSTYHLSYGIWNFCIRWGITISERSQRGMAKFSFAAFIGLTVIGIAALVGFFLHKDPNHSTGPISVSVSPNAAPLLPVER